MNAATPPVTATRAGHRAAERKTLTRRRFLTTSLAATATAGAAAVTAGLQGIGTPPTYLEAPVVEKPFTPADPDSTTLTVQETPPVLGPMELAIPSLGIHASLVEVGLEAGTNKMVIPPPEKVGHYTPAAPIGAAEGSTILAGHVNNGMSPGALWNLAKAQNDALVSITDQAGQQFTYKINGARTVTRRPLPEDIYRTAGDPQLVLVTCAGTPGPDGEVLNYDKNTIITAIPV